ncbi:hypothetical protein BJ170DRAFT_617035 [Xylariales sp. AK1849]|nr:hypothetical protein BJ170DRAFT_617035 [Xylariales sp. AK1849]
MSDRTPLLESTTGPPTDSISRKMPNSFRNGISSLNVFRSGLIAPNQTTYNSLVILLNEEDSEKQDRLTEQWRDHKLQELNFIGVVGALLAGVLTSTGSWPSVLANGNTQPWTIRAFWFCGIIFALFAVLTAAQQTLYLHRLSAHRDGLAYIRRCMSGKEKSDGRIMPRWVQVYAWQASVALLTAAVFCMVLGMTLLVWVSTNWGEYKNPRESWWDENAKVRLLPHITTTAN